MEGSNLELSERMRVCANENFKHPCCHTTPKHSIATIVPGTLRDTII